MQKIIKSNSGIYLLELKASSPFSISAKKFTEHQFDKGYYYYSGSAQKNLSQRVRRHLKKEKTFHWHIDHLTCHKSINIKNIFVATGAGKNLECDFVKTLLEEFELKIAANGFGNGDCDKCPSHLLFSKKKIDHNHFISLYQSTVCLIPSSKFIC